MKRRLYFLLPDAASARQMVDDLLLARIDSRHVHVLAREDVPLHDLPEDTLVQKSDLVHGLETGLVIGGATGALAGIAALTLTTSGTALGGDVVLASALAGALIGTWISGMIAGDVPNSRLKTFRSAIEEGRILTLADVPKGPRGRDTTADPQAPSRSGHARHGADHPRLSLTRAPEVRCRNSAGARRPLFHATTLSITPGAARGRSVL